ncbi:MAG: dipeptidyl carboxypeptidase II, partial [Chthoniobacterales bacterium]
MKKHVYFLLAAMTISLGLTSNAAPKPSPASSPAVTTNPLLKESTLPYQFPPFDKIKDADFQPAIEQGMAEQLQEIGKIANQKEKPTFDNTIVAMEKSGRLLQRANRTFSNLNACNTNPAMQQIDKELSPKLAAHQDAIRLNGPLFARIQSLYNQREQLKLDPESKYLLERYY